MTQSENKLSSKLTTVALTALGLSRQPFSSTISGDRCFVDAALQDQLSLLMHNLRYSDHIQLLKGPTGIGKTTLLAKLVAIASGTLQIYIVRGHQGLQAKHVVRDMLKTLDESCGDEKISDELTKLGQLLALRSVPDVPVAIVIDDADQLPITEFEQLLLWFNDLSSQLNESVKILLLAKPEIEETLLILGANTLVAGKVFHCELHRYNLSQVEQYIQHHLELAGFLGKFPLNHQHLSEILEESGGIPLLINEAAVQRLNENLPLNVVETAPQPPLDTESSPSERKQLLLGLGAVLLVIVAGTFFLETTKNDSIIDSDGRSFSRVSKRVLSLPESPFKQVEAQPATEIVAKLSVPSESPLPVVQSVSLLEKQNAATVPVDDQNKRVQNSPADAITTVNQSSPVNKSVVEKPLRAPVDNKDTALPKSVKKDGSKPTRPIVTEKTKNQQAEPPKKVVIEQKVKPPEIVRKNKKPEVRTNPETVWLLAQNPRHFTVQLIASRERRVIDIFIKNNKIPFRHGIFKTSREGKSWYVLVAGSFSGPVKARQSISRLPEGVRANGPWVRSFLSIQKAIIAEK